MNTSAHPIEERLSQVLRAISAPARLRILLAIGEGEACVCHLETVLGMRQAYISQQLMSLRDAGLLQTRREGRFIYYRLQTPEVLALIRLAGKIAGVPDNQLAEAASTTPNSRCCCPKCASEREATVQG